MNQVRKNFIFKNEQFGCENCGLLNEKGDGFIRNHCKFCLYSKHVDLEVPGDRLSNCCALMEPISVVWSKQKGYMLVHKCKTCAKSMKNKLAPDDDMELVANLSVKGYVEE